jgi:hypothetical protein
MHAPASTTAGLCTAMPATPLPFGERAVRIAMDPPPRLAYDTPLPFRCRSRFCRLYWAWLDGFGSVPLSPETLAPGGGNTRARTAVYPSIERRSCGTGDRMDNCRRRPRGTPLRGSYAEWNHAVSRSPMEHPSNWTRLASSGWGRPRTDADTPVPSKRTRKLVALSDSCRRNDER